MGSQNRTNWGCRPTVSARGFGSTTSTPGNWLTPWAHRAAMLSKIEAIAARLALVVHAVRLAVGDETLMDAENADGESVGAGITIARWFCA